jgi:hypothetical protein
MTIRFAVLHMSPFYVVDGTCSQQRIAGKAIVATIRGLHQGQRPQRPHSKAVYMAAPDPLVEMSDFPLATRAPPIHGTERASRDVFYESATVLFIVVRKFAMKSLNTYPRCPSRYAVQRPSFAIAFFEQRLRFAPGAR